MKDCFTCEYAERDKHNRFIKQCSGSGNCDYSEFRGEIKPTLEEFINTLNRNITNKSKEYMNGFRDSLRLIKNWDDNE